MLIGLSVKHTYRVIRYAGRVTIGQRIRKARNAIGMSQGKLATIVGVKKSAVSQWEGGQTKDPKPENLLKVADATGVSLRWLITGHGPMEDSLASPEMREFVDWMSSLPSDQRATIQAFRHTFGKRPDGNENAA